MRSLSSLFKSRLLEYDLDSYYPRVIKGNEVVESKPEISKLV